MGPTSKCERARVEILGSARLSAEAAGVLRGHGEKSVIADPRQVEDSAALVLSRLLAERSRGAMALAIRQIAFSAGRAALAAMDAAAGPA